MELTIEQRRALAVASARLRAPKTLDYESFKYAPTVGMSGPERVAAGAGKAVTDLVRGARQYLPDAFGGLNEGDVKEARKLDKPLAATKGGRAGELLGTAATALPLALAPGANTLLGAGLYGAGYGALQPAESGGERISNIALSGIGSAAVTGAVKAGPALYNAFVSPFTKKGQEGIALDTISRFASDKNALSRMNVDELIPGSKPTLAETTGDAGIAQLQRAAQAASPETANLMAANKATRLQARKDALMTVAGTHDDKAFFEAARDMTASRLYGDAFKDTLTPDRIKAVAPDVKDLLARPSVQSAKNGALRLAKEEGEVLTQADLRGGSLKGLHYMKRDLDSQISKAKASGDNNLARVLIGTQDKLVGVMQKLSPKYAEAMAEYQSASKPINAMEIGKYLYEKLIPALSDLGAERITPQGFAKALSEGDEMAKKATGFKGARLVDILTSEQMNTLINLGQDLGREAGATARGAVPGSPTAQYLSGRNAIRQILGPLGLPGGWAESVFAQTIAGRGISAIARPAENAVQNTLGRFLVNPGDAQAAAAAAQSRNMPMIPLSNIANKALPPISVIPGLTYANQQ